MSNVKSQFKSVGQILLKLSSPIEVRRSTKNEVIEMRELFTPKIRYDFRCSVTSNQSDLNYDRYTIHHVIPIAFGGTHHFNNLILIAPECHLAIHEFFNQQPIIPRGRYGVLLIPKFKEKVIRPEMLLM